LYRWATDDNSGSQLLFIGQGVMFLTGLVTFGWGPGNRLRTFESLEHMFDSLNTRCLQFLDGEPISPGTDNAALAHR